MNWRLDDRWVEAHHDMRKNDVEVNCAIIDGRPAKCWWKIRNEDGEWKKVWYDGYAKIMESGHEWAVIYEEESVGEEHVMCKFIYNAEEGGMYIHLLRR